MDKMKFSIKRFMTVILTTAMILGWLPVLPTAVVHASDENLAKVTALKTRFDSEKPTFKPHYGNDTNINNLVLSELKKYQGLSTEGVSVEVASSSDQSVISSEAGENNGKISYISSNSLDQYGHNWANVSCSFKIKAGEAEVTTDSRPVLVGWDVNHVNEKIEGDKESNVVTWSTIGNSQNINAVTSDLTLPRLCATPRSNSWSFITWTSSNNAVINPTEEDMLPSVPLKGKVTRPKTDDVEVTLTATFSVNSSILNDNIEKVKDFKTYTKVFNVTVEGKHIAPPTAPELNELLHTYYLTDNEKAITNHNKTAHQNFTVYSGADEGKIIDFENVRSDIQLTRPTSIPMLDDSGNKVIEDGETVYAFPDSKEISFSVVDKNGNPTNDSLISLNGRRIVVDRGASEPTICYLKITFKRDGVTTSEILSLKVMPFSDGEINAAKEQMKYAKEHYWDAINDGRYDSRNNVTGGLHAFYEINKGNDGKPVVCYEQNKVPGTGIKVQGYFPGKELDEEGYGYNNFKSSKPSVIKHNNLNYELTGKPEYDQKVTISSLLCHAAMKDTALKHPENTKLAGLINQEVSVTITIPGIKGKDPNASEDGAHKDINVRLTMAVRGDIAKANDGSLMAQKEFTVKDDNKDGDISLDEVLKQAHEKYNSADGYVGGSWVTRMWGYDDNIECGFYRNGKLTDAVNAELVDDNDSLLAFISKGSYNAGSFDKVSFFDSEAKTVKAGEAASLILKGQAAKWDDPNVAYPNISIKDQAGNTVGTTDSNGVASLMFTKEGTYTVYSYGTIAFGNNLFTVVPATCVVTVTGSNLNPVPAPVPENTAVTGIKLNKDGTALKKGKTLQLTATVLPETAANKEVIWSSSNEQVATVSNTGLVTAVKNGKATITATTVDGGFKATCKIAVNAKGKVAVKKVKLDKTKATIKNGEKLTLKATITPVEANNKKVTWKSSNTKVARVSKTGEVTAAGVGKATITVTTVDGRKTAKCSVSVTKSAVKKAVTGIKLNASKKTLKKGASFTLKATVTPKDATNKAVTWKSSNPKVATVTKNGKVKAVGKGSATITATAKDGSKKQASCKVTVKAK